MKLTLKQRLFSGVLTMSVLTLASGCSDDDNDGGAKMEASYEVKVVNITHGQPLTPIFVVAHRPSYHLWELGNAISTGLEALAEGGDTSQVLSDAQADMDVAAASASGSGPFGPGDTQSLTIGTIHDSNLQISVASMLANSNDGFTGVSNLAIGDLAAGESLTTMVHAYDAGTEANTETAATIPGPAGNGEGFNAARDDVNFVSVHAGVVTSDDGLSTSALTEAHRWLGPTAKIVVTRLQ